MTAALAAPHPLACQPDDRRLPAAPPAAFPLARVQLRARWRRDGRLVPWLGPALRGLVAGRFRSAVCRQPIAEQQSRWRYCQGCPLQAECSYGVTFEGPASDPAEAWRGQDDATRPLVIAPQFPLPDQARSGESFALAVLLAGRDAVRQRERLVEAFGAAGRHGGLGPDEIPFDVEAPAAHEEFLLDVAGLPPAPDGAAGERVRIELASPLFLRTRDEHERRRMILRPTLDDLLRASFRTLGQLQRGLGGAPLDADFPALKAAAAAARLVRSELRTFRQGKWSNRSGQHLDLLGVVGAQTFDRVSPALLPWLFWGGRLHVGLHRVAGAGGWRVLPE